ncbi:ComF family protein [Tianweitania sp. BSSL-BM11]|uniref:ComF family protein n=1 Tax=Tianweitania aestuarii TaxID=2814886 RepID=A0ABS5RZC6_9HYPH|nr:ComF family protein [Tianweitania aestuarii]MBS9722408.1 ComF family protein [Tianweitania aestuarii]
MAGSYVFAAPLIKTRLLFAPVWLARAAAKLLFPPICLGCQTQVAVPGSLCGICWANLRLIEQPFCPVMGTPFREDQGEGFLSAEAIANPPPFTRLRSAAIHTGLARRMVGDLKYRDRTDLAPWMARWMLRAGSELIGESDLIVAVPLHRRRFFQRRYNQSAELARSLSGLTGLTFEPDLINRTRPTRQQVGLHARQRQDNVRGAFRVDAKAKAKLRGKRVLLIDDVYTTGATVSAVSRTLLRNGAAAVHVLTFSRVLPDQLDLEEDEA